MLLTQLLEILVIADSRGKFGDSDTCANKAPPGDSVFGDPGPGGGVFGNPDCGGAVFGDPDCGGAEFPICIRTFVNVTVDLVQ